MIALSHGNQITRVYPAASSRKTIFILLLICIFGLVLRLINLSGPSLWFDELMTGYRANSSFMSLIGLLRGSPFPPLYYLMMNLWVGIFGDGNFALRFPSAIFSTLSIPLIFILSKELFDERTGLMASLLLSVSPYAINYGQDAKMYSMFWALGILSFIFFWRFAKDQKRSDLIRYVISTAILLYTSYFALFFIAVQNILIPMLLKPKQLIQWLLGQLTVVLFFLPWFYIFTFFIRDIHQVMWIPNEFTYRDFLISSFLQISGVAIHQDKPGPYLYHPDFYIFIFMLISSIFILRNLASGREVFNFTKGHMLLFGWIIIPLALHYTTNHLCAYWCITRYLGFMHIPLIILVSKGLSNCWVKVRLLLLTILLVTIFIIHLAPYYKTSGKIQKESWKELSEFLYQNSSGNTLVITLSSSATAMRYFVNYYVKGCDLRHLDGTTREEKRNFIDNYVGRGNLRFLDATMAVERGFTKGYKSVFVYCRKDKIGTISLDGYALKEERFWGKLGILWYTKIPGGDQNRYFFHSTPL